LQDNIGDIFVISLCFIPVIIDWKDWTRDKLEGPSWLWSYGSCNLYNQCLSPLMLWVRISIRARYTTLCDKACQQSIMTGIKHREITKMSPIISCNQETEKIYRHILFFKCHTSEQFQNLIGKSQKQSQTG
jgi:hypothetical protein